MGINSINGQDLPARIAPNPGSAPASSLRKTPEGIVGPSERGLQASNEEQAQSSAETRPVAENPALQTNRPRLRIDRESQTIIIQIVDPQGEVVKQIPPEDFLKNAENFRKIQGLLFDERT